VAQDGRAQSAMTRLQVGLAVLSAVWLAFLAICYLVRWPGVVAVTVFPAWFWAMFGVALGIISHCRKKRKRLLMLLGAWMVFLLLFCEEPRALLTSFRRWPNAEWQEARDSGTGFRVISLNCAGGQEAAAEEALRLNPDVLLLQETPPTADVEELLERYPEYDTALAMDASIIARGGMRQIAPEPGDEIFVALAQVELDGGRFGVISTRFLLPHTSPSIWRPATWRQAAELYEQRREQMETIVMYVERLGADGPVVLGGDFNTPAGDSLFRLLPESLSDSFRKAGTGLGNTITNEYPVSRIDYIWIDRGIRAHAVVAKRTDHSDHRMVIADLSFGG